MRNFETIRWSVGIVMLVLHTTATYTFAQGIESNATTTTTPTPIATNIGKSQVFSARAMGRSLAQCLRSEHVLNCLENEMMTLLSAAAKDNATWHLGDSMQLEKITSADPHNKDSNSLSDYLTQLKEQRKHQRGELSFGERISEKLLQLLQTRALRIHLPQQMQLVGISDTLDEITTDGDGFNATDTAVEEGRKKKYKDKNMAMMGGMAMMAMFAQMFLGKVILIAGAAFIMAKIALVISLLGSLKKGTSGSHGSTEHVIVAGSSGGHSHESSGWHRSMPYEYTSHHNEHIVSHDEPHTDELTLPSPSTNSHNDYAPYSRIDANPSIHRRKRYKYELSAKDLSEYIQPIQPQQNTFTKTI